LVINLKTAKALGLKKDPHAVALGRKGGRKGGKARWDGVPPEERTEILRRAVLARWARAKKARAGRKEQ
jgi:hypothetical protein